MEEWDMATNKFLNAYKNQNKKTATDDIVDSLYEYESSKSEETEKPVEQNAQDILKEISRPNKSTGTVAENTINITTVKNDYNNTVTGEVKRTAGRPKTRKDGDLHLNFWLEADLVEGFENAVGRRLNTTQYINKAIREYQERTNTYMG